MKRIILVTALIFGFTAISISQTSITEKVFRENATIKIDRMQDIIGFDELKSRQLKELELVFLLDVQKAETCFLCSTKRRVEKLIATREERLKEILDHEEYLKFHSVENDLINENNRLWLESEN